jgi:hypothetical protein
MSDKPVDWSFRALGWFIAITSCIGLFKVVEYIESLDLNHYIGLIIIAPLGWLAWMGSIMLIVKFELFGSKGK